LITDPVTVNIRVGWGEVAGGAMTPQLLREKVLMEPAARMSLIRN